MKIGRLLFGTIAVLFVAYSATTGHAENSITIPSFETLTGTLNVQIPIRMVNDTALQGIVAPMIIRSTSGGAFVNSVKASFGDRLPPDGPMADISYINHYANEDGNCKAGQPGGFGQPTVVNDTTAQPVSASPYAILFSRFSTTSGRLTAGSDVTGSFLLTVDIGDQAGTFEVDTTCTDPTNHQYWVESGPFIKNGIPATFIKGVITVLACDCPFQADFDGDNFVTALDLGSIIDLLFAGATDIQDPTCPSTRSDFDCDGFATALDLSGLVDYLFAGGNPPCDPCVNRPPVVP